VLSRNIMDHWVSKRRYSWPWRSITRLLGIFRSLFTTCTYDKTFRVRFKY